MDFDLTVKSHNRKKNAGEAAEFTITLASTDPKVSLTIKTANPGMLQEFPLSETFTVKILETGQKTLETEPEGEEK